MRPPMKWVGGDQWPGYQERLMDWVLQSDEARQQAVKELRQIKASLEEES